MKKKHIVCFGDSNTHGYRASNDSRYDEQERWTCLLQKQLGDDYLIIEEGLSGDHRVLGKSPWVSNLHSVFKHNELNGHSFRVNTIIIF